MNVSARDAERQRHSGHGEEGIIFEGQPRAASPRESRMIEVGSGKLRYGALESWERLPEGWDLVEACGVAVDSRDRVHLFSRGEHPVVVLDRDGRLLGSWGKGAFARPHGITIGPGDSIYLVDDLGHAVRQTSPAGEPLRNIGPCGTPSDTGASGFDYRTIRRTGPPF